MKEEIVLKSKAKKSSVFLALLGGLSTLFIGVYFILQGQTNLLLKGTGILFGIYGLYCLYWCYNYNILFITKYVLIVKIFTGAEKKRILLKDIKSYSEKDKENMSRQASMNWKELTLNGKDFNYKIYSNSYSNYDEIKEWLTKGVKKSKNI